MKSIKLEEISTGDLQFSIPSGKPYMADIIAGNPNLIANLANVAALASALNVEPKKIARALSATSNTDVSTTVLRVTMLRIAIGENYVLLADADNHKQLSVRRRQIMEEWKCHEFCFNNFDYEDGLIEPTRELVEAAHFFAAFERNELRAYFCTGAF